MLESPDMVTGCALAVMALMVVTWMTFFFLSLVQVLGEAVGIGHRLFTSFEFRLHSIGISDFVDVIAISFVSQFFLSLQK